MKKKNRVIICILSAMILGSCLVTPVFAAESTTSSERELTGDFLENYPETFDITNETIISQVTKQLPLTDHNMIQHEEITNVYEDGLEVVTTLKSYVTDSPSSSSWTSITGVAQCKVKRSNKPVVLVTVNGTFRYDSANKVVERTNYSKNAQIQDSNYSLREFNYGLDTGRDLNGKMWAYVRANFKVVSYAGNYKGYAEVKCNSDGLITTANPYNIDSSYN